MSAPIPFDGAGVLPQIMARGVADQAKICDSETDLIKSTFDVTVRRVKRLSICEVPAIKDLSLNLFDFLPGYGGRPTTGPKFTALQREDFRGARIASFFHPQSCGGGLTFDRDLDSRPQKRRPSKGYLQHGLFQAIKNPGTRTPFATKKSVRNV